MPRVRSACFGFLSFVSLVSAGCGNDTANARLRDAFVDDAATTHDAGNDGSVNDAGIELGSGSDASGPSKDAAPSTINDSGTEDAARADAGGGICADPPCELPCDAAGGVDCAVDGLRCAGDGTCKPKACEFGELSCADGSVQQCADNQTAWALYLECADLQVCVVSDEGPRCEFACEPGASVCDGDVLKTCNLDGATLADGGFDCTATGEVCDPKLHACAPKICEPHTSRCDGASVVQCMRNGAAERAAQSCLGSLHCKEIDASAYCVDDVCSADTPLLCEGTVAYPCAGDGSGPDLAAGFDCATQPNSRCSIGRCWPCWEDYHRVENNCVPNLCVANLPVCGQNRVTTCAADTDGFESGGTDCAAMTQICDASLQCVDTAIDEIGSLSGAGVADSSVANVYLVTSDRLLTQIETYLRTTATSLTWVVYVEGVDASASFNQVFEKSTSISAAGSLTLVSSGAISVPLSAGKRYSIGVLLDNPHSFDTTKVSPASFPMLSFGRGLGSDRYFFGGESATIYPDASLYYHQRITTEPMVP
jgi:hypothetical protein